jgi:hypothetical protein
VFKARTHRPALPSSASVRRIADWRAFRAHCSCRGCRRPSANALPARRMARSGSPAARRPRPACARCTATVPPRRGRASRAGSARARRTTSAPSCGWPRSSTRALRLTLWSPTATPTCGPCRCRRSRANRRCGLPAVRRALPSPHTDCMMADGNRQAAPWARAALARAAAPGRAPAARRCRAVGALPAANGRQRTAPARAARVTERRPSGTNGALARAGPRKHSAFTRARRRCRCWRCGASARVQARGDRERQRAGERHRRGAMGSRAVCARWQQQAETRCVVSVSDRYGLVASVVGLPNARGCVPLRHPSDVTAVHFASAESEGDTSLQLFARQVQRCAARGCKLVADSYACTRSHGQLRAESARQAAAAGVADAESLQSAYQWPLKGGVPAQFKSARDGWRTVRGGSRPDEMGVQVPRPRRVFSARATPTA